MCYNQSMNTARHSNISTHLLPSSSRWLDLLEWAKCLINPKRETWLRIEAKKEERILMNLDWLIVFVLFLCLVQSYNTYTKWQNIKQYKIWLQMQQPQEKGFYYV